MGENGEVWSPSLDKFKNINFRHTSMVGGTCREAPLVEINVYPPRDAPRGAWAPLRWT
jgi:hypothetical protein